MTSGDAVAVLLAKVNAGRARNGLDSVHDLETDIIRTVRGRMSVIFVCRICGCILGTQRLVVKRPGWTTRIRTAARLHRGGHVMDEMQAPRVRGG